MEQTGGHPEMSSAAPKALAVLRRRPGWSEAVGRLKALECVQGEGARAAAAGYREVYAGRRGAMVFDVVASRQRRYTSRVLPLVERWSQAVGQPTLEALASKPIDPRDFGLQAAEPATMQTVAANLLAFGEELDVSEDEVCHAWATGVEGLEHAHKLDPIVGGVSGIGPALFAYMRMRCGANALKPDLRVAAALRDMGFSVPGDEHSILVIARAAAEEIGIDLLSLDQLLWGRTG